MRESSTYRAIIREGRILGIRDAFFEFYVERFGNCPPDIEKRVQEINDENQLLEAICQVVQVPSPAELKL